MLFLAPILALLPQSPAAPAPASVTPKGPVLARVVRDAELVAYARVLRLESRELESVEGKPVRMQRGVKETRLAELELGQVLAGEAPAKRVWLLAQRDRGAYDLELDAAGAQVLVFLTLGDDPTPEGCTYLAHTQEVVWRAADGKAGLATVAEEAGQRSVLAPGFGFEAADGELAKIATGADGRAPRVGCAALEARIAALAAEQRGVWIEAGARGGRDEFAWQLVLRHNRSATLTIERAQGPEAHEIRFSAPVMDDIALRLDDHAPAEAKLVLGAPKERGLVRRLKLAGGAEVELLSIDREWMDDAAHKVLARWVLPLYASLRSGIREPGLLDGRVDDREWLR